MPNLAFIVARSSQSQTQGAVAVLMQRELGNGKALKGVRDLDIVEPLASHRAESDRGPALESDQHRFRAVETQRGVVAGAVTQQRQTEVESASQGHLASFT